MCVTQTIKVILSVLHWAQRLVRRVEVRDRLMSLFACMIHFSFFKKYYWVKFRPATVNLAH